MSEKEDEKVFRFAVYQQDILLCEKIFDANQFNPFTRYSINIRDILPRTITRLQKTLSRRSYDVEAEIGRQDVTDKDSPFITYDLFRYQQRMINSYPKAWRNSMRYTPQPVVQQITDSEGAKKTIRGVECKMGLYINEYKIVERMFYVDGFNPVARWSVDLTDVVVETADLISSQIKKNDIKNMWDDYDLINIMGYSISQIRELHPAKRAELLRRINRRR